MTLIVRVPGSATPLTFDDSVTSIPIGRDPDVCRTGVLIPEDQTEVGRIHCTIDRVAGYYRLALNKHHAVLVNGKMASDGQELGDEVDLQLGAKGPKLVVKTELSGKVKPTSSRFEQKGQATHLRESEASARRGGKIAVASIVLLLIAGFFGLGLHHKSSEELQRQRERIAAVENRTEGLRKLEDTMKRLAPSVYLMGVKDPRGGFSPEATAWVIDQEKGILATNGHVGQIFFDSVQTPNKDETSGGYQFIARSTDKPTRDFVIDSVKIHPGFYASADLFGKFQPQRRASEISVENIDMEGPFCDVALLFIKDPTGLGPALPIADQETLESVGPGDDVALIGFPMENLSLGGVTVDQPTPKVQFGHVIALTNYFEVEQTDFPQRLLLEHSIPSTGGASGSAILNDDGKVVAFLNAGNAFFQVGKYYRLPSAALINYGQRVDIVNELLDGTADTVQKDRTAQWEKEMGERYVKLDDALVAVKKGMDDRSKRRHDDFLDPKIKDLTNKGYQAIPSASDDSAINTFVGVKYVDKYALVRLDQAGELVFYSYLPYSDTYDSFMSYHAKLTQDEPGSSTLKGDLTKGDNLKVIHDDNHPWFWSTDSTAIDAGDLVACEVSYSLTPKVVDDSGHDQLDEYAIILAFFKPAAAAPAADSSSGTAASHRLDLASQWVSTGAAWVLLGCKPNELEHWSGTVGSNFAIDTTHFDTATSSDYLFVVNSSDGSNFSFDVSGEYGDGLKDPMSRTSKVLGSSESQNGWATVAVNVSSPSPGWFQTSLMNAAPGTKYEVYVYHPGP